MVSTQDFESCDPSSNLGGTFLFCRVWTIIADGIEKQNISSLGGLEPPTFRLTAERANQLRHRDLA